MTTIAIWQTSRAPGVCRSCGQRIIWTVIVKSGKRMPWDAPLVASSVTQADDGRLIEHIDPTEYPSHFATCPQAPAWRRKQGARA